MSRIAAETGIGRATLYKYFSDVVSSRLQQRPAGAARRARKARRPGVPRGAGAGGAAAARCMT
jgi:hypothetical protein